MDVVLTFCANWLRRMTDVKEVRLLRNQRRGYINEKLKATSSVEESFRPGETLPSIDFFGNLFLFFSKNVNDIFSSELPSGVKVT